MKRISISLPLSLMLIVALVSVPLSGQSTKPLKPKSAANYGKYEFKFTTLDGKSLKLSDYAGKVVLVNIWAPWCGPCKMETPGFVNIYKQYQGKGFEILSVAVNTNETDVRSYIDKYGVRWPVGIKDEVGTQFGTYGIPDNLLFNSSGTLIKRFVGYTKEEALRPLLDEALKSGAKTTRDEGKPW